MRRTVCRSCWTCLCLWLTVCSLAAAADAAAAGTKQDAPQTECSSSAAARFNFFPKNAKNIPEGWTQNNQHRAGNNCNGQLLPIALYGSPKPLLHFQPQHEMLNRGARIDVQRWDVPLPFNASAEQEQIFSIASYNGQLPDQAAAEAPAAAKQKKKHPFGSVPGFKGLPKPPSLKPLSLKPPSLKLPTLKPPSLKAPSLKAAGEPKAPQLSAEARGKVLKTFVQVLLTGNAPDEIEVSASKPEIAASSTHGWGRQQPTRYVVLDRGNGDVEHYSTRDRILMEGEVGVDSSADAAAEWEGVSSSNSSVAARGAGIAADSSSSSGSRVLLGSAPHSEALAAAALQERGSVQANADRLGLKSKKDSAQSAEALQQIEPTASNPALFGGLIQVPWGKDRSTQPSKPVKAGLAGWLPGFNKQASGSSGSSGGSSGSSVMSVTSRPAADVWTLVQPANFVYSVRVNGKEWFTSPVHYPNSSLPLINFEGNATAGRRDLFDASIFVEGINTMDIKVTLLQDSAQLNNGTHDRTGPSRNVTFNSPEIDFYFFMWGNATHDSRPSAVVQFDSCKAEANINFSKARPTPVLIDGYRLTYTPIPDRTTAFFLPVYHIYGQFQKGLDGSTDLKTDNTEGNIKSFGLYLTRLPGSPSNFRFSGPQLDGLKEGWWQMTVEGSLWVPLPHLAHLLSLSGIDRYGNSDVLYRQVQPNGQVTDGMSLLNSVKGAGWVLPEYANMQVGLQKAITVLDYFEGPSAPLVLGDKATFTWQWTGLDSGNNYCRIEGKGTVSLAGNCSSPLTYTIRTNLNQTLLLNYKDVCGKQHNASLTFGPSFGWHVEAKELGQGDLTAVPGSPPASLLQQKNSAGSETRAAGAVWWRVLCAAVAAWSLAVLFDHL